MKYLIDESFKDFPTSELPYDKFHTALGEYHHINYDGYTGSWYDPIDVHQWRTMDGSWMVTSDGINHYMEQNRGNPSKDAFKNVYATLANKQKLYCTYGLDFSIRLFELNSDYAGIAVSYITSRLYYAVGINQDGIAIFKRDNENIEIIAKFDMEISDLETYSLKLSVGNSVYVYLDNKCILKGKIDFKIPSKIALVSKCLCRYSNIKLYMTDFEYKDHLKEEKYLEKQLDNKKKFYPKLKLINKIDLKNFGSGRQLRITMIDNKPIFILAQHQKRYIRDSFARLSSMTAFDYNGNVLWTIGEPNNSNDNTLISCDLPFQIADINNDGKKEVIYSQDFEIRIIDLLTGKLIKSMPTPIIKDDPLVKNEPFYRLNVDAIRVADFEGLGYKGDFIIKDRYQNVWAYDKNMELMFRYHNKNTGHFPYIFDYDNDNKDEMFVGYDLIDNDGKMIFDLDMNSDHTDEIIYAKLNEEDGYKFILASGNEGMNIINKDGTMFKHNEIGHAQRVSVAPYNPSTKDLWIMATAFWGSFGIIGIYDSKGELKKITEMESLGAIISPINYDGSHVLALTHAGVDGGLIDYELDTVVKFPDDGHPTLCQEVYDIDNDGIDEIICWDQHEMWFYKAEKYVLGKKYEKYPDEAFSNYRGEYLIPKED